MEREHPERLYAVIEEDNKDKLINHVEDALDVGWKLQGGIMVYFEKKKKIYAQAVYTDNFGDWV